MKEKIARICWNSRDWKRPSGSEGKSRNDNAYENISGFGHEEWLLDDTKVMQDGYHYSFLQPINTKAKKHVGQVYDIHLFTFNPMHIKEYVGCIKNVECISPEQAHNAYKYYRKCGWLREMKEDVLYVGGKVNDMNADSFMFNIRFKFCDADIKYSNRPIIAGDDPNTKGLYYKLMDKESDFIFERDEEGNVRTLNTDPFWRINQSGEILVDPLHKKLQNAVEKILNKDYVHLYSEKKPSDALGQRIDMKGQQIETGEWHYFEFKTYSAKRSIREALGQILEYVHYPSKRRAKKMFIIGPEEPDENDKQYMKQLREIYNIPIWFRWYSFQENKLYNEI
jgi:hypothetical protein